MLTCILTLINLISKIISIPQTEFIPEIIKNLNINNCIIIKNQVNETNIDISFTKYLSKFKIQVAHMNFDEMNKTMYQNYFLKINKPRTFVILDLKIISESLLKIFNYDNEPFLLNYIWAIFDIDEIFIKGLKNIYIPYNCQFFNIKTINNNIYEIFEMYHLKIFSKNIYKIFYGIWEKNKGIKVVNSDFYGRRFNMNDTVFPAVNDYLRGMSKHPAIRAYKEIVTEMGRMMNFRPFFMSYNKYTELWDNGTEIMYEFSIGLFVLHYFAFYPDMIAPIWKAAAFFHIAYDKNYEQGYSSPHTKPFTDNLWTTIIIWILISGLCIFIINHLLHKNRYSLINGFFMPFDSFTNQCGDELPKTISARIAIIMTRLAPLLITSVYSAAVLSFITVKIIDLPFNDLRGLVENGKFKIGYENGTFFYSFFRKSNDLATQIAWEKHVIGLNEMPRNPREGIEKMCKDSKFAFLFFNNDLFRMNPKCEILQIPEPVLVSWDAISLRDYSTYTRVFNRILKTFGSAGILKKMEKNVYERKVTVHNDDGTDPVRLESVAPLLKFISSLYLISLFLLLIECACYRKRKM